MTRAAASITRYSGCFRQSRTHTVLDYGAGTLRNALFLARHGFTVYAADLPEQAVIQRGRSDARQLAGLLNIGELQESGLGVDLVLSTYVFNIIMENAEQRRYLDKVVANLRPGGYLLINMRPAAGYPLQRSLQPPVQAPKVCQDLHPRRTGRSDQPLWVPAYQPLLPPPRGGRYLSAYR